MIGWANRKFHRLGAALTLLALLASSLAGAAPLARAAAPANSDFYNTWARTDLPVAQQVVNRTWLWAPEAFTVAFWEEYAESPGGFRAVQYFDKSRMEINDPGAVNDGVWFVTNGLLVVEMIEGKLQAGDGTFHPRPASGVPVAGDPDDTSGPTYAALDRHRPSVGDRTGQTLTTRIARDGATAEDPSLAELGISFAFYDDVTGHNIAAPFWDFMRSRGTVYQAGQYVEDQLFLNEFYATGRPITEPFFADVKVGNQVRLVLLQCFERRCLTYTPDNPEGWQVEAGNVGLHYFCWRYGYLPEGYGPCIGSPVEPPAETPPGDQPPPPPPGAPSDPPPGSPAPAPGSPGDPGAPGIPPGQDEPPASPTAPPGGSEPTPPRGTETPMPTATATGTATSTATATATSTATATATATGTVPAPPDDAPSVDVLPLSFPTISVGIGQSFTLSVQVRNTGTQSDTVSIRLRTVSGISTCPFDSTLSRVIGAGETVTVNFSQSCLVALNVVATYEATATISRAPGASDTERGTATIQIGLGGGSNPTPTPPAGNAPGVDVLPLNLPNVTVGVGETINWRVQVRNTGTQEDTVSITFRSVSGITTCPINQSQSRKIGPGQTVTVTFSQTCLVALNALVTYEATATISRAPGASDTERGTALVTVNLLGGGGGDPVPPDPPAGNAPGVDVLPLNFGTIKVKILQSFNLPVQVKNTGTQSDSVKVRLRTSGGVTTCPFDQTKTVTIAAGQTATVTFTQSCAVALNLAVTYQATATIDRAPGASDTESTTVVLDIGLLGAPQGGLLATQGMEHDGAPIEGQAVAWAPATTTRLRVRVSPQGRAPAAA